MDDLSFLRERIESYADYTNDGARRLADEQIRAYVGEALSHMHERLQGAELAGEVLSRVLLRCQFADQFVVRALDSASLGTSALAALHAADRELVALASRAGAIDAGAIDTFAAAVEAALDARARIITNAADAISPRTAS